MESSSFSSISSLRFTSGPKSHSYALGSTDLIRAMAFLGRVDESLKAVTCNRSGVTPEGRDGSQEVDAKEIGRAGISIRSGLEEMRS